MNNGLVDGLKVDQLINLPILKEYKDSIGYSARFDSSAIKNEYKSKLKSHDNNLTEEHEMLIDFVTLTLSLLVKTPPNLRERLIEQTTDNEMIKKILLSKLPSIEKHYIPVSLLEIAISKEER